MDEGKKADFIVVDGPWQFKEILPPTEEQMKPWRERMVPLETLGEMTVTFQYEPGSIIDLRNAVRRRADGTYEPIVIHEPKEEST
jgi:hypothetical protein